MTPIKSENSSYQVPFEGPIVRCQNETVVNVTLPVSDESAATYFSIEWDNRTVLRTNANEKKLTVTRNDILGYYLHDVDGYPTDSEQDPDNVTHMVKSAVAEQRRMTCKSSTAIYTVAISYDSGVQTVFYSTTNEKLLDLPLRQSMLWSQDESQVFANTTLNRSSQAFRDWEMALSEWRYKLNSLGILDSLFKTITYEQRQKAGFIFTNRTISEFDGLYRFPNGTEARLYHTTYPDSGLNPGTYIAISPSLDIHTSIRM